MCVRHHADYDMRKLITITYLTVFNMEPRYLDPQISSMDGCACTGAKVLCMSPNVQENTSVWSQKTSDMQDLFRTHIAVAKERIYWSENVWRITLILDDNMGNKYGYPRKIASNSLIHCGDHIFSSLGYIAYHCTQENNNWCNSYFVITLVVALPENNAEKPHNGSGWPVASTHTRTLHQHLTKTLFRITRKRKTKNWETITQH